TLNLPRASAAWTVVESWSTSVAVADSKLPLRTHPQSILPGRLRAHGELRQSIKKPLAAVRGGEGANRTRDRPGGCLAERAPRLRAASARSSAAGTLSS